MVIIGSMVNILGSMVIIGPMLIILGSMVNIIEPMVNIIERCGLLILLHNRVHDLIAILLITGIIDGRCGHLLIIIRDRYQVNFEFDRLIKLCHIVIMAYHVAEILVILHCLLVQFLIFRLHFKFKIVA